MTHKEEAIKRVNEFKPFTDSISVINYSTDNKWHLRNCKQCALLAIDREIEVYRKFSEQIDRPVWIIERELKAHFNHLEKVKQEIEQM